MKRLALFALLLISTLSAAAEIRREDTLLTRDGTLFLVRSIAPESSGIDAGTASQSILTLTTYRDGEAKRTEIVPGSLNGGLHSEPTLAWDEQDQRLYLFWMSRPAVTVSELVIASWKDGVWSAESRFGSGLWTYRLNLRLALSHGIEKETESGDVVKAEGLTVHAVWWNQEGANEAASHAMFTLDRGRIVAHPTHALLELITESTEQSTARTVEIDPDVLRTPFVLPADSPDRVDVLFADFATGSYYLVTLTPRETKDGRLRIPLGVASPAMGPPVFNRATEHLAVERRPGGGSSFVIYTIADDRIEYVSYEEGRRGDTRQLLFDGELTPALARSAVARLVAESQPIASR